MHFLKLNIHSIIPSIFLIACSAPFVDEYFLGLFNEKRIFQSVTLLFYSMLYFYKHQISSKLLILIIFLGFWSVLLSYNLLYATLNYIHTLMLLSAIIVGYEIGKNNFLLFITIFFCNLFITLYSLLNYFFFVLTGDTPTPDGVLYGFYNIRFFNQFQVLCIPFIIYFLKHNKLSRIATIILTLNFFLFFMSGARGAIVSTSCMVIFSIYYKLVDKENLLTLLKCCIGGGILFFCYFLYHNTPETVEYLIRTNSSNRFSIWSELISQITTKNIVIGNGSGVFFSEKFGVSHPHNSILQLLYNWGLITTTLLTVIVLNFIKTSTQYVKKNSIPEFNSCLQAFLALIIYSLVTGILVMPIPQTFIFILAGVLLSYLPIQLKTNKSSSKKLGIYSLLSLFYILLVILSYNCLDSTPYGPNFWSYGQLSFSQCKIILFKDL